MQFILTADWLDGTAALTERLIRELHAKKQVLWLVCGGSNIGSAVKIMHNLPEELTERLSITLTDERYGKVGHPDSNWAQLQAAGFEPKRAQTFPVLAKGESLKATVERYDSLAERLLDENEVVIAQFGIGADGHIAGILPNSPATEETKALAAGYEAGSFTRLTLTFPALSRITAAYTFVFGAAKKEALSRLESEDIELQQQPAQILKQLPEAYVYSDQVGERV